MKIQLVKANEEATYTVTAYRTAVPELAVHRRLSPYGVPIKGCWDVTHIPTGLKITGFPIQNRTLAKAFVDELAHLNWSFDASDVPKGNAYKIYGKAVREARATIKAL